MPRVDFTQCEGYDTPAHDESFAIDSPWDWNLYKNLQILKKGGKIKEIKERKGIMVKTVMLRILRDKNCTSSKITSKLVRMIRKERKKIKKEIKKKRRKIMKPVCNRSTNGNGCRALKSPETGLYEPCAFSGFCPNCNGNSKEERKKFLENTIMTLCVRMSECRRRLEKGGRNYNKKQSEIKNIKKQVQAKVNDINREIKLLSLR